jgi:hypothetical protein
MKDRPRQLYVTEMTRTLRHPLATRLALEIPVYCSHSRVHQTAHLRFVGGLVHDLRILDFGDRVGFLATRKKNLSAGTIGNSVGVTYDFLWREDTKLHLLHFSQWRG